MSTACQATGMLPLQLDLGAADRAVCYVETMEPRTPSPRKPLPRPGGQPALARKPLQTTAATPAARGKPWALCTLGVLAVAGTVVVIWAFVGYRSIRNFGSADSQKDWESELLPRGGPATPADAAVAAVMKAAPREVLTKPWIWKVDQPELGPTPTPADAEKALDEGAPLRAELLKQMQPGLETAGADCLLNQEVNLRDVRQLSNRMADDVLSLFLTGKQSAAVQLLERTHRFGRVVGRGSQGQSSLIARMIAIAVLGVLDRCTARALERKLVDDPELDALDALYVEALRREVDLDPSMQAEFDVAERVIRAFDRRLGPAAFLLRWFWWGDGLTQLAALRKRFDDKAEMPSVDEFSRMHLALQIAVPNVSAALDRYRQRLSSRHGVRAAIALERARRKTGVYPAVAPADILDPANGKPFLFKTTEKGVRLYGLGPDGRDDGGNDKSDAVVW